MNVQISVQEYRYGTRAYEVGRELQRYPLLTDLLPGGRGGGGGGGNRCPPLACPTINTTLATAVE